MLSSLVISCVVSISTVTVLSLSLSSKISRTESGDSLPPRSIFFVLEFSFAASSATILGHDKSSVCPVPVELFNSERTINFQATET